MGVTALLFTKDNARDALALVNDVYPYVDEILIIDSSREENKRVLEELARRKRKVRVIWGPPLGMADFYYELGLNEASQPWILHLDVDERPSDQLLKDLKTLTSGPPRAYIVLRVGKRTGAKNWVARLFHKSAVVPTGCIHWSWDPLVCVHLPPNKYWIEHAEDEEGKRGVGSPKFHRYVRIEALTWAYKVLYIANRKIPRVCRERFPHRVYRTVLRMLTSLGTLGIFLAGWVHGLARMLYGLLSAVRKRSAFYLTAFPYFSCVLMVFTKRARTYVKIGERVWAAGSPARYLGVDTSEHLKNLHPLGDSGLDNLYRLLNLRKA